MKVLALLVGSAFGVFLVAEWLVFLLRLTRDAFGRRVHRTGQVTL